MIFSNMKNMRIEKAFVFFILQPISCTRFSSPTTTRCSWCTAATGPAPPAPVSVICRTFGSTPGPIRALSRRTWRAPSSAPLTSSCRLIATAPKISTSQSGSRTPPSAIPSPWPRTRSPVSFGDCRPGVWRWDRCPEIDDFRWYLEPKCLFFKKNIIH